MAKKTLQLLLSFMNELQIKPANRLPRPVQTILRILWETLPSKQAVAGSSPVFRFLTLSVASHMAFQAL